MAAAKGNNYTLLRKVNPQHTKEEIEKIIEDLLEWAANGEGVYLATYLYETYKKDKNWLHSLADGHPELKDAIDKAKQLIAGKVTNHCWIGDRNSSFGEKILPIYCKDYKEETERRAKVANTTEEKRFSLSDLQRLAESGQLLKLLSQPDAKV
jgi:hypothetical protein